MPFWAWNLRVGTERRPSHRVCLRVGERSGAEGSSRDQRVWRERPFWRCEQISSSAEFRIESMERACGDFSASLLWSDDESKDEKKKGGHSLIDAGRVHYHSTSLTVRSSADDVV